MMRPLTSLTGVLVAALTISCLCQELSAQPFREINFETTGDFGLATNWSDPMFPPPENPPGAPATEYANTHYYINDDQTATISFDSENGSHFQVHRLYVGDSGFSVTPTPGTLVMNGGPEPAPGEFGASLHVVAINEFRMGRDLCTPDGVGPCTGGGTVMLNGASDILANGLIVGERSDGNLFIGPDARVRVGVLNPDESLARQDTRIGSFGPERGTGVNGNGLVQVEGEFITNTIYMPESDATGVLRVMPGGIVDTKGINLAFEPFRPNRSSRLEVIGSGGAITMTFESLLVNDSSVTLSFTADAGGVTPIVATGIPDVADPGGALLQGANLELDLDAFNFNASSTMTLIDVAPDALFGEFGTVTFLGNTSAEVEYDTANGDVFLFNFQSTVIPLDGDYNNNGVVDAADYTVWQDLNGTTATMPNDTTPGIVSRADYDVWRDNFGMMSGSGAVLAAVPEPASLATAMLFLGCCAATRRSRRSRDSA